MKRRKFLSSLLALPVFKLPILQWFVSKYSLQNLPPDWDIEAQKRLIYSLPPEVIAAARQKCIDEIKAQIERNRKFKQEVIEFLKSPPEQPKEYLN